MTDTGHWENRWICSVCGYKLFDHKTNYCPNCGANMMTINKDDDLHREKEQAYMKGWEEGRADLIKKMKSMWGK